MKNPCQSNHINENSVGQAADGESVERSRSHQRHRERMDIAVLFHWESILVSKVADCCIEAHEYFMAI